MTKEELNNYEKLQDAFQTRCKTICQILIPLHRANRYADEFKVNGDSIVGRGYEEQYYNIGEEVHGMPKVHVAFFPKEYIYMDDNEIQKIVDDELKRIDYINTPKSNR